MEPWKRGIWATSGAVLVIVALVAVGTWYVAAATNGNGGQGTASLFNPFVILGGIVALVGIYMLGAALGNWPLPGRAAERQIRADLEKVERIRSERFTRINEQLSRLIADAEAVERCYLESSIEAPDESMLVTWSDDARSCIAKIDVKLLPSFDQQRAPAGFCVDGRSPQLAQSLGLLHARTAFLSRLKAGR